MVDLYPFNILLRLRFSSPLQLFLFLLLVSLLLCIESLFSHHQYQLLDEPLHIFLDLALAFCVVFNIQVYP